jgi:DNA-binding beta-propeller fold protein YncE
LNGDVLLVEPHYTRVNRFDPRGKLLEQWGENGTNVGQLIFPRSLAVAPDGAIWVSEYAFAERIQKFSPGGTNVLLSVGRPGGGPGEFNRAEGIGVDAEGRLYTADSCNHRIQVFSADGTFLRQYGTPGNRPGEMSYPYDIRIDAGGRQFVCEFGNSRIQVFDREDRLVELIGGPGRAPGQFNNPWSIALDSQGNLIVADSQNHRVQKLWRRQEMVVGREENRAVVLPAGHSRRSDAPPRRTVHLSLRTSHLAPPTAGRE